MWNNFESWSKNFLLLIVFFIGTIAYSQQDPAQKTPLKEVIPLLEDHFDIRFSYREQDVKNISIFSPSQELNLKETLVFLERQTGLKFKILDERYIAITASPEVINFCGMILDAETNEPLPGATVQTIDQSETTISDMDGKFMLRSVKAAAPVKIRFLGYHDKFLEAQSISEENCQSVLMEPSVFSLRETVVVNYLTAGISKQKDGSIHINTDRFGALPGQVEPDVLQTVESLPGVESVNETVSNINIRGGTSDQNLVLFDDIKMYLTGHFFGLISALNPNLTKDVTVVKNGTSPSLNDGVSGTIDIRSEDELVGKFSGGAGLNLVSADAFLQVPVTEKFEIHVSGRKSINDLVDTPTYDNYFSRTFQDSEISLNPENDNLQDSNFSYYDTSLKALYDLNKDHKFRFSLVQIYNNLDYTEYANTSEASRQSSLAQNNLALGGNWSANWSENFSTEIISYLSQYQLEALNFTVDTDQRFMQENDVLETGLKINTTTKLNSNFNFLNGYQFYEVGVSNIEKLNNPFFSSTIKNVVRSHSLYSELKYSGNTTYVRGGFRINYLPKFEETILEPRLSFNQELGKYFSFKLLGEFKSQTTSQIIDLQEDFLGVENRRWTLADQESYPIIKSKQISSGIDFKRAGWYLDLEGFYKKVEGISTSNQGFQDQNEFIRTSGSYISKGFEVLINKKAGDLNAYMNYTFGKNDYTFEELNPQNFPNNFDITHSLSVAANYSYRDFKFSAGGHVRSGKPYTEPVKGDETRREGNNWVVNYSDPNAENLPNFVRVDLSASYSFDLSNSGKLQLGLGILNLLNRENIINRYYRVDSEDNQKAIEINNKSLGFTPNASVNFTF
ncbi:carboxypeptidase-like regulatory domain-containing protein [Salinimicrobium gaetbulicola]|uniref:Carboxypeptidase-like regulatory domain-containing protein n=1 Tax=Salinimicrobium gaetbulicola TaxID=999702 RepID=A0ABW3IHD6_9FLAO